MTIGSLARRAGVRPSAVRYYERLGLLPVPPRCSGRRDYGPDAIAQLAVVQFALSTGFTLRDVRTLVHGFPSTTAVGIRWRVLAAARIQDIDELIARATTMKTLLQCMSANCTCATLTQCGGGLARSRERWSVAKSRPARRDA